MFPKLSQKAWKELLRLDPNAGAIAFMSLFDLEKYPITKDMVFEYLKAHPDYRDNYSNGQTSYIGNWDFYLPSRHGYSVNYTMCIDEMLQNITIGLRKDKIIVIGEIHGWWEKGDQNEA